MPRPSISKPGIGRKTAERLAFFLLKEDEKLARGIALPRVAEGDLLAFLPAGAYGSSMASDHCLRGFAKEVVLEGPVTVMAGSPAA